MTADVVVTDADREAASRAAGRERGRAWSEDTEALQRDFATARAEGRQERDAEVVDLNREVTTWANKALEIEGARKNLAAEVERLLCDARDAIANARGLWDTPIARRRNPSAEAQETREHLRSVLARIDAALATPASEPARVEWVGSERAGEFTATINGRRIRAWRYLSSKRWDFTGSGDGASLETSAEARAAAERAAGGAVVTAAVIHSVAYAAHNDVQTHCGADADTWPLPTKVEEYVFRCANGVVYDLLGQRANCPACAVAKTIDRARTT